MFLDISTISYLPEPIKTKIKKYQKQFSKKFKTVQALDWVPHLTIADRVLIPKNKFDHICQQLKTICYKTKQLKVTSKNLGFTTQTTSVSQKHYVIFIKIEVTQELQKLHDLIQRKIYQGLKRPSYESNKYAPHITLAYKDLTKENFNKAKKFLKKY
ncbi:2'-5' RNA ligase family protein, partial [Patescibacteria group bacterium]|nr:2'-5' RNA ligase family protein [Patescibacteria group bacterium]